MLQLNRDCNKYTNVNEAVNENIHFFCHQVVIGKQYQNHNSRPGPVYAGGGYTPINTVGFEPHYVRLKQWGQDLCTPVQDLHNGNYEDGLPFPAFLGSW